MQGEVGAAAFGICGYGEGVMPHLRGPATSFSAHCVTSPGRTLYAFVH